MGARLGCMVLLALLGVVHTQLWMGRGSIPDVAHLQAQLTAQYQKNQLAVVANSKLEAEIKDLTEGLELVEEKARMELGKVEPNEIFVQFPD